MSVPLHLLPTLHGLPSVPTVVPIAQMLEPLQVADVSLHFVPVVQHFEPVAPQSLVHTLALEHVSPDVQLFVAFVQQGWPLPPHAKHLLSEPHSLPDVHTLLAQQVLPATQLVAALSHLPLVHVRLLQHSFDEEQADPMPAQHLLAEHERPMQQSFALLQVVLVSAQQVASVAHLSPVLLH